MKNYATRRYTAKTVEAYRELVTFVALSMDIQTTLYPLDKMVIVVFQSEGAEEIKSIAQYIHDSDLDICTEPIEEEAEAPEDLLNELHSPMALRNSIRRIISDREVQDLEVEHLKGELEKSRKDAKDYNKYWMGAIKERDELKKQIEACVTLLSTLTK